jgi:RimJ/RimL family protein N-acetyltransferase
MVANGVETSRLILERLDPAHAEILFAGLCDEQLYEFIDAVPPDSVAALRSRYERLAAGASPDAREIWLNWVIQVRFEDRYAGFVQATIAEDRSADIAYVLLRSFWGFGYGLEAVTAMINHLRNEHGIGVFRATVDPRNIRSISLLEKLGFKRIAHRKNCATIKGTAADECEYALPIAPV